MGGCRSWVFCLWFGFKKPDYFLSLKGDDHFVGRNEQNSKGLRPIFLVWWVVADHGFFAFGLVLKNPIAIGNSQKVVSGDKNVSPLNLTFFGKKNVKR